MTTVEIIGAPQSAFVRAARMACEEKGVPYRLTPAVPHTPEVDCIHPYGKIPVMRYGDYQLCESKAIACFIDRTFPGPKLFPDDAKLLGKVEQWVSIINTTLIPAVIPYFGAHFFPKAPDGKPDRAVLDGALPGVRKGIEILDKAVAGRSFLAGSDFSYADISVLPVLAYLRNLPESGAILAGAGELSRYFEKHSQRASFKATVPPPFSELRSSPADG